MRRRNVKLGLEWGYLHSSQITFEGTCRSPMCGFLPTCGQRYSRKEKMKRAIDGLIP